LSFLSPAVQVKCARHRPTIAPHSGLPVPAGESLILQEYDGCDVAYTLSGYYAQP